ncbi:MAG: M23 family metallopeptidase [Pseudomonadales bacterium]|nr:M23 family metallopeptidase [Pseudomonadales bacterium]MCP5215462.1 M23 family metallopeptidase [Pseudomonadales bacterium]
MNIIFVSRKHGRARTLALGNIWLCCIGLFFAVLLVGVFSVGYRSAIDAQDVLRSENYISTWIQDLKNKDRKVEQLKQESEEQLESLTIRMAELHARLIRLDALGEHLTKTAKLEEGEFDFSRTPALGGPSSEEDGVSYTPPNFIDAINQLSLDIELREQELEVLNKLLGNQEFESDRYIAGRPVKWGWMSSGFGRRNDPFSGRIAWHEGVDFAGKENSEIIAVAAGVVTWSGLRNGYGKLLEVNHGGGLITRYAHANKLLVKVGDVVEKGQTIALMGSSGRSTGPHVHYEILKNGTPVNPINYIKRKNL